MNEEMNINNELIDTPDFLPSFLDGLTIDLVLKILVAYVCITWIATIVWVIRDINVRTHSIIFKIFCVLIVLVWTPLCIPIYLAMRPNRTLYDKYYDEIEANLDILDEIIEEREKWKNVSQFSKDTKIIKKIEIKGKQWEIKDEIERVKEKIETIEDKNEIDKKDVRKKDNWGEKKIIARIKIDK